MQKVPRADRVEGSAESDSGSDAQDRKSAADTEAAAPEAASKGRGRKSAKAGEGTARGGSDGKSRAPKGVGRSEAKERVVPRLKERYRSEIAPALLKEFGYSNPMQVPQVSKVVINVGLGELLDNPKALESVERDIAAITGQHPVATKAKKSIANFKVRQGMTIGMMVTLRGNQMYEFLDRLINIAMPRIRDFRGAPANAFDGRGNYSLGLREQVIFPEIDFNDIDRIRGLQVTIVTTARDDEEARSLLTHMGVAFSKEPLEAAA